LLDLVAAELDRREEMLRDANIPLEPSAVDATTGGRRRAEAPPRGPGTRAATSESEASGEAAQGGYPWDGPDSGQATSS
jgi:hypothetical protein